MKESEAKGKACPWGVAPKCLARGCMAWIPMLDEIAGLAMAPVTVDAEGQHPMTKEDGSCARIREALRQ